MLRYGNVIRLFGPNGLDDVEVVVLQRIERLAVRRADVVALEELLDEHLPVHRLGRVHGLSAARGSSMSRQAADGQPVASAGCHPSTAPMTMSPSTSRLATSTRPRDAMSRSGNPSAWGTCDSEPSSR